MSLIIIIILLVLETAIRKTQIIPKGLTVRAYMADHR